MTAKVGLDVEAYAQSSMLFWYPKIKGQVPTPNTVFIPLPKNTLEWMDDAPIPKDFIAQVVKEAKAIGYPIFMRTDVTSAKFNWVETCFVKSETQLTRNLFHLIEENLMIDMMGEALPSALVLREFLKLDTAFLAFKYMPVAREFRLFMRDGEMECWHPYWPEDAIKFWGPKEPKNWRSRLAKLSEKPSKTEWTTIEGIANKASAVLPGYWSVDLCRTNRGWYVTDCARAEVSHHVPCPHAPKELV
jgi:hypothetical protein